MHRGGKLFVSHSSCDGDLVSGIVSSLASLGIHCWIAPRDILPGEDWTESILEAIGCAQALLLIATVSSLSSGQVRREIERATDDGIPILTIAFEDSVIPDWLRYYSAQDNLFFFNRNDIQAAVIQIMQVLQKKSLLHFKAWQLENAFFRMDTEELLQQRELRSPFSGELRPVYVLWVRISEDTPIGLQTLILTSAGRICNRHGALPIPTILPGVLFVFDSLSSRNCLEEIIGCGLALETFLNDVNRKSVENGFCINAGVGLAVQRAVSPVGPELVREIEGTIDEVRELAQASDIKFIVSEDFSRRFGYACKFTKQFFNGYAVEPLAPPSERASWHSTALVGREIELSRLLASVKAMKNSEEELGLGSIPHKLIGVRGGPGLGKSRLMQEFLKELRSVSGITVVLPLPGDSDWQHDGLWGSMLSQLRTLITEMAETRGDIQDCAGGLPEEFCFFLDSYGMGCSSPPAVKELESWRRNLFNLLEFVASKSPLVVILEDIDRTDSSSFETLRTLLNSQFFNAQILFVLTYCDSSGDLINQLSLWSGGNNFCEEIELNFLSDDEAEAFLLSILRSSGEDCDMVDRTAMKQLFALGGGSPLFFKQLLDHSLDRNLLRHQDGRQPDDYDFLAPPMEIAALAQLSRLDRPHRDLIRIASAIDSHFSLDDLNIFCKDLINRNDMADQLSKLVREGLLEIDSSSFTVKYRFTQESLRLVAYNTIPQDDRILFKEGR